MAKAKKKKPKYNENSAIRSAVRRAFSRSPLVQEVLKDARSEQPKYNKDGSLAKKPAVFYTCAQCYNKFKGKHVAVDHIDPVIPIGEEFKDWNTFIFRLWCKKDNLQVLCSYKLKEADQYGGKNSCHHDKTQNERIARKALTDLPDEN